MFSYWVQLGRFVHIAGGFTALIAGGIVLVTAKGTVRHRQVGWWFVGGLFTACLLSLLLQVQRYVDAILSYQAVLALYLVASGTLELNKRLRLHPRLLGQLALAALTSCFCLGLLLLSWQGKLTKNPVLVAASISGGFLFTLADLIFTSRLLRRHQPRRYPVLAHAIKLVTAFIVMLSAFSSISFTWLPTPYREIWPTVLGLPLLYGWVGWQRWRIYRSSSVEITVWM